LELYPRLADRAPRTAALHCLKAVAHDGALRDVTLH
jgi:hypothetical protein